MSIDELKDILDTYLAMQAYDSLFAIVEDKTAVIKESNELSLFIIFADL